MLQNACYEALDGRWQPRMVKATQSPAKNRETALLRVWEGQSVGYHVDGLQEGPWGAVGSGNAELAGGTDSALQPS